MGFRRLSASGSKQYQPFIKVNPFLSRKLQVDLKRSVKARLKVLLFQLHTVRAIPRVTKILSSPLAAGLVSFRGPLEEERLLVKTMEG